jgi:hypothetical protein
MCGCKNPHRIGAQDAARKTLHARRCTQDAARKTLRVLLNLFARDEAIRLLGAG